MIHASKPISTAALPASAFVASYPEGAHASQGQPTLNSLLTASIGNLCRLGLIEAERYMDGGSDPRSVFQTAFGLGFCSAVFMVKDK